MGKVFKKEELMQDIKSYMNKYDLTFIEALEFTKMYYTLDGLDDITRSIDALD